MIVRLIDSRDTKEEMAILAVDFLYDIFKNDAWKQFSNFLNYPPYNRVGAAAAKKLCLIDSRNAIDSVLETLNEGKEDHYITNAII